MSSLDNLIDSVLPGLPGWCTPEKGKRIAHLVTQAKPRLCVELGVFGGRSLVAFGFALRHNEVGHIDGIDPFTKSAALEGTNDQKNDEWWANVDYEDIMKQAVHGVESNGLAYFVNIKRAKSLEMVDQYADGTIDILHQDSNHSAEVSTAEVRTWISKIRVGGFWIFDDINWSTTKEAQRLLMSRGFIRVESYETWAIFQNIGTEIKHA